MAERIFLAVLFGIIEAVIVWVASTMLHAPRIWPGTILGFAMGAATTLAYLRRRAAR